jgi:hypothetical protein
MYICTYLIEYFNIEIWENPEASLKVQLSVVVIMQWKLKNAIIGLACFIPTQLSTYFVKHIRLLQRKYYVCTYVCMYVCQSCSHMDIKLWTWARNFTHGNEISCPGRQHTSGCKNPLLPETFLATPGFCPPVWESNPGRSWHTRTCREFPPAGTYIDK